MNRVILFALLLISINSLCMEGCLKCDITTGNCLFCDLTNNFYLSEEGCVKGEDINCQTLNLDGTCHQCVTDFYPTETSCQPVETKITNCLSYDVSQGCRLCEPDHYLTGGLCEAVSNPIPNCIQYDQFGETCVKCNKGTFLYIDRLNCITLNSDPSCMSYSQITCKTCDKDYSFNQNAYIKEMFGSAFSSAKTQLFISSYFNKDLNYVPEKCVLNTVKNCAKYYDFENCIYCKEGYDLEDNQCVLIGLKSHDNCLKKDAATEKCLECVQGYYLQNKVCVKTEEVSYCVYYDNKENGDCIECESKYYLTNNLCRLRKKSVFVEGCIEYSKDEDSCKVCEEELLMTTDKLGCLPLIANCVEYHASSHLITEHRCKLCGEGFLLDSPTQTCKEGHIENCQLYDELGCLRCFNGFYRELSGLCIAHEVDEAAVCEEWSQKNKNECISCPNTHISVRQINNCKTITAAVTNCLDYNDTGETCIGCESGFTLGIDGTCTENTIENCKTETGGLCQKCNTFQDEATTLSYSYELSADQLSCNQVKTNHITNCVETDVERNECIGCTGSFYPSTLPFNTRLCYKRDFYKLDPATNSAIIDACEVFDFETQSCLRCKDGKYVEGSACVSACTTGNSLFLKSVQRDYADDRLFVYKENYCDTEIVANCEVHDISIANETSSYNSPIHYGCVKCKTGFLPIIDMEKTLLSIGHTYNGTESDPDNVFVFIDECIDTATANANKLTVGTDFANCKYYLKSNGKYGCLTCEFGFTGLAADAEDIFFLETCTAFADCDTSVVNVGLGNNLYQLQRTTVFKYPIEVLLSCHACTDNTKILAFSISSGAIRTGVTSGKRGAISPWDHTADPAYSAVGDSQNICITPDTALQIPTDCSAIAFVVENTLTGYVDGTVDDLSGVICVSCKPGYKAVFNNIGAVESCTLINNCTEPSFNGCRVCADGYAIGYDNTLKTIAYDNCFLSNENCFSGYLNNENIFVCTVCKPGYILNADFLCDTVELPNCVEKSLVKEFFSQNSYVSQREPIHFLITHNGVGCKQCESDYIAAYDKTELNRFVCVNNNFVAVNQETSSYFYVAHCLHSYFDTTYQTIRCKKCEEPKVNVNGKCVDNTVNQEVIDSVGECEEFDYFAERCKLCRENYFLLGGVCYEGNIANCIVYKSQHECQLCMEGFVMLYTTETHSFCFELTGSSCLAWNADSAKKGRLECETCETGSYKNYDFSQITDKICLKVNAVTDCKLHKTESILAENTFECLECYDKYFLFNNKCIQRALIEKCVTYDLFADKCVLCEDGYSITAEGYLCSESNLFIFTNDTCMDYYDKGKCMRCYTGFVLEEDKCVKLAEDRRIDNCEIYISEDECEICKEGYHNEGDFCKKANAANCKTYESVDECSTCPENHVLTVVSPGRVDCTEVLLENCELTSLENATRCALCNSGFYLDKDYQCQEVTQTVEFCIRYLNNGFCEKCDDNMALSEDFKSCFASPTILSNTDFHCNQAILLTHPVCVACNIGYYWEQGNCEPCGSLVPNLGCLLCDPSHNIDCLICMPGYFMNEKGDCIIVNKDEFDPDSYETTSIQASGVIALVLSFFLLN